MAGLAMVVALVAAPAAVGAVSLFGYRNTGVIEIQETSPAADKMTVTARFPDGLYFTDSAGISGTDAPCSQVDAQTALCTVPGTTGLNFNLERKNDRVAVDLPSDPALELFRYKYALGDGNDRFSGGIYPEEVSSGVGKDRLVGGAGNDSLSGGKDADRLDGGDGEDACNGGPDKDQATSCESVKGIP
jgi:Ca2+-binding RTX toxin-like protein